MKRIFLLTGILGGGGVSAPQPTLFDFEYTTDDPAVPAGAYSEGVGSMTITGTLFTKSGGRLQHTTSTATGNPSWKTGNITRQAGLAFQFLANAAQRAQIGWFNISGAASVLMINPENISPGDLNDGVASINFPSKLIVSTDYELLLVLFTTGGAVFQITGGALVLLWVAKHGTSDVYAFYQTIGTTAGLRSQGYARGGLIPALDTLAKLASLVAVAAVSGTDYVVGADVHIFQAITAPGTLAGEAGIRFRKSGTSYEEVKFNSAGALIYQQFLAGVGQGSPVTLASGVITNGATRTIYVITIGSTIAVYTLNGTTVTKQGSNQTSAGLAANTGASPFMDASWSGGGGTLGNIEGYPRSNPASFFP